MAASFPHTFKTPESRGSAIHPLLLSLFHTFPSLAKCVAASSTDDKTLSHAVKKSWASLGSGATNSAQPVWDLIGESTLVPADSAELLAQMCDLFDAELTDAAAKCLGVKTRISIQAGARLKEGPVQNAYSLALTIPLRMDIQGSSLSSLLKSNFETEKIDYMFPDDVEPVDSDKQTRLVGKFNEGLVIHLQRYRYDFNVGSNAKIYDRVEYPEHISGSEFAPFAEADSARSLTACNLDLVAVVTHNDESGYGMLLRPDAKGSWFRCSDSSSNPTETSIESAFGGDVDQDIAYMLFYKVTHSDVGLARKMSRAAMTAVSKAVAMEPASKSTAAAEAKGGCCVVQ